MSDEKSEYIGGEGPYDGSGLCYVQTAYVGPCALSYSGSEKRWAIFPSRSVAVDAAWAACKYDLGGYSYVEVLPLTAAPNDTPRYNTTVEWLFEGQGIFDDDVEQSGVRRIARRFMRELVHQIAASPWELAAVEWRDLERLLYEVFVALGFEAKLTRSSKDGGFDIRLDADGYLYLIEIKHWSKPKKVGDKIVSTFTEVVVKNEAEGLILSTSGFTDKVVN